MLRRNGGGGGKRNYPKESRSASDSFDGDDESDGEDEDTNDEDSDYVSSMKDGAAELPKVVTPTLRPSMAAFDFDAPALSLSSSSFSPPCAPQWFSPPFFSPFEFVGSVSPCSRSSSSSSSSSSFGEGESDGGSLSDGDLDALMADLDYDLAAGIFEQDCIGGDPFEESANLHFMMTLANGNQEGGLDFGL